MDAFVDELIQSGFQSRNWQNDGLNVGVLQSWLWVGVDWVISIDKDSGHLEVGVGDAGISNNWRISFSENKTSIPSFLLPH